MSATFIAKYPGTCAGCGERIRVGDQAHYVEDQVCHADCDDVKPEPEPRPVCPECFVEVALNGACAC